MKKSIFVALAAASLMGALAPAAFGQNLAIVNGKPIPKARLDALVQQMARAGRQIPPEAMNQFKDEVIMREIIVQDAQARGFDATEDFKTQMEISRQNILIREVVNEFQKNNPVTDAEAKAEYDKFVAANSGKEYHARHILVEKEDEAKAIIAQIKKGAKFEAIAKKQSKDPGSGANGGELDWAAPSSYVKEFSEAMVALGKGKMTETPVKTQFGYHIIRLDDIRDVSLPKFEDVKPQVVQQLQQQKMVKFQEDMRAKARIE